MKAWRICELCNGEAALYCASDSAFLCWTCDARVHEANFLVARHVRHTLCCKCEGFDGNRVSGVGFRPRRQPICRSCSTESDDQDGYESSTTCSTCISTAESVTDAAPEKKVGGECDRRSSSASEVSGGAEHSSPASTAAGKLKKRISDRARFRVAVRDVKAEEILKNWCRKLNLKNRYCVAIASRALSVCLREVRFAALPWKILIASSLWLGWKASEGRSAPAVSTRQNLKRLEEICGVPAKLISMAESKIARVLLKSSNGGKAVGSRDDEEGWAECSD